MLNKLAILAMFIAIGVDARASEYVDEPNEYAASMLALKEYSDQHKVIDGVYIDEDTQIKSNMTGLKIAFEPPVTSYDSMIGVAPIGVFLKDKGWTGYRMFFNHKDLVCAYSFMNLDVTDGIVVLTGNKGLFKIGGKRASRFVSGNSHEGFLYSVTWADKHEINLLDCARAGFDRTVIREVERVALGVEHKKK